MEEQIPQTEIEGEVVSHSPVIKKVEKVVEKVEEAEVVKKEKTMDFPSALREVTDGKKITKLEWGDSKIYGFLSWKTKVLTLRREDGQEDMWCPNDGDLLGTDWIVL